MADNTLLNTGTGGDTIATDDVTTLNGAASAGVKVQRFKNGYGDDNSYRDVSVAFPLPVFDPDVSTTGSITAQDTASTTAAGANGQSLISGTPTAGSNVSIALSGESAFAVLVLGTWTGALQFERSLDGGATYTAISAFSAGTPYVASSTTTNGAFHGNGSAATNIRVRATAAWTGTATIRIISGVGTGTITVGNPLRLFDKASGVEHTIKAASTAPVATDTAFVVGAHPSSTFNMGAGGSALTARPDKYLFTTTDPITLLVDVFDGPLDTTNTWNSSGTNPPTATGGNCTFSPGTTANATSYLSSQAKFSPFVSSYVFFSAIVKLASGALGTTGNNSFWGLGIISAPTVTVPTQSGVVFEIESATGNLLGSVYSGGSRTQSVALAKPSDGLDHRYTFYYKTSTLYFLIDGTQVGSIVYPNPAVSLLSYIIGSTNGATALTTGTTITSSFAGIGDTGRNSQMLSDGTFPWIKATIKKSNAPAVATDTALVVAVSPNNVVTTNGQQSAAFTGNITTATSVVGPVNIVNAAMLTVTMSGTYAGISNYFEVSSNGTDWVQIQGRFADGSIANGMTGYSTQNPIPAVDITLGGWTQFRVRAVAYTSGTGVISIITKAAGVDRTPSALVVGYTPEGNPVFSFPPVLVGGTDGANARMLRIKNTAPAAADYAAVVALSPNSNTAKGAQPATAVPTQDLKDSGRNQVHYYTLIPVLATATDTLQSLTGTKGGAAVAATATPALVTAGKTLRITRMSASYISTATSGYGIVRLRFNTAAAVAIASPVAATLAVGNATPATANAAGIAEAIFEEGIEFAAGTGIGVSVQGFAAATAAAVGYVMVSVTGYEY